ncbi:BREX-2 system adenine-specific DNA-methyltransferase PglX [Lipingzhangella sp. LS1_29]|uniref:site-specific DNA-methyltransferase (adenine-specific) n=1 Tax=Lipingzhangella rawalii TaxID=2055835 RepID=A0ABU2H650_9ACTN|nr:BREX-2 system adenine-specific DNA-methyltransferase PglX [Lipingzhangella rawalii]MDS1270763.1 BREX-2 system adenine-specific DNA-methyltransferase PglX [Lipingzhangella rawalii]
MIDPGALREDLVQQVRALEADLHTQVAEDTELYRRLRGEYDRLFERKRTAETWTVWLAGRLTQVAVAWVLGTLFVRYCEDTGLVDRPFITGPDSDRRMLAEAEQEDFFHHTPHETDRGWLRAGFAELANTQPGALLFSTEHNPLYQVPISHDAAKELIGFWRRRGEHGQLVHDFSAQTGDTRFLGDLYQDLSETARKTYALLQTPEFVEEFILDRTLTPAIDEFGYDQVRMIDPTCGSGHFVLGTFHRLLAEWEHNSPMLDPQERVRRALQQVHGVDVNPFAVAIARFRLWVAALHAAGLTTLHEAKKHELPINLAVGDSLLQAQQDVIPGTETEEEQAALAYSTEDLPEFGRMLEHGRYHVVVGNPPYVTVKDAELSKRYREQYSACHRQYSLSVPFAQRFFQLAREPATDGRGAGHVGQITANSFMKREFGKKLIQEFFALRAELTEVIDTSGAFIPGHGTPTVILIGRNRSHAHPRTATVRTVMGIRGEPEEPDVPSQGHVWQAIVNQINQPGSESAWVSVADVERGEFAQFPWSLAGGGADEVLQVVAGGSDRTLEDREASIGRTTVLGEDDAWIRPDVSTLRRRGEYANAKVLVIGEAVRDYAISGAPYSLIPYSDELQSQALPDSHLLPSFFLWFVRRHLSSRIIFGRRLQDKGHSWFEHLENYRAKLATPLSIAFAFVATHNHFVLDRGGKVFNRSAPVIKLPEGTTEDDHLELLGVLNSSTTCFWLKQVSQGKGGSGLGRGHQDEEWEERYEFTGTKLQEFPLPASFPLARARRLDSLAQDLAAVSPVAVAERATPTRDALAQARTEWHSLRARMIAEQEELDWEVYRLYGLLDEELTAPEDAVPELALGERAFEIVLARRIAAGEADTEWFNRHGSTPITELPAHWPAAYRAVVERRIELIESNRHIGLIERPECKRRWSTEGFDAMQAEALRTWLLDRMEARELWFTEVDGVEQPQLRTTVQLADALRDDPEVLAVAELYAPGRELEHVVAGLVADEHVPYLSALRYKDSGLAKRAEWEHVWDRQRQEDAAEDEAEAKAIRDATPVPPKYASGDFRQNSYWRNRGKLDVPKERFISYPYAGRDGASSTKDGALLLGWAGFDHREQAHALAVLLGEREQQDGWGAEQLAPLLAGLRELLPWLGQWHSEFHPDYGDSPAEFFRGFLSSNTERLGLTDDALTGWRPPRRGRAKK